MAKILAFSILFILFSQPTLAEWTLNKQASRLTFISTKNACKSETHTFKSLSGKLSDEGQADLQIDLSSVDTKIPIRDKRMQDSLFEIVKFPKAEIAVSIKADQLLTLPEGQTLIVTVPASLSLHGVTKEIEANLSISKLNSGDIVVKDVDPIVVSLSDFDLLKGLEKLQAIAKLKSIENTVPVSLSLIFSKK